MSKDRKIVALVRDLMFSGRISAEARAVGVACRVVREPSRLAENTDGQMLLVDLTLDGAIPAAVAWRTATGGKSPVIGFAPHVEGALIGQARAGGFDQVLTRGQFVQILPGLLQDLTQNSKETHEHPCHPS